MRTDFNFVDWDRVEEFVREMLDDEVDHIFNVVQGRLLIESGDISPDLDFMLNEHISMLCAHITEVLQFQADCQKEICERGGQNC